LDFTAIGVPSRWFIELTALIKLIELIKLTGLNNFTGLNGYHPLILINHSTNQLVKRLSN